MHHGSHGGMPELCPRRSTTGRQGSQDDAAISRPLRGVAPGLQGGPEPVSNFDYAGPLTEICSWAFSPSAPRASGWNGTARTLKVKNAPELIVRAHRISQGLVAVAPPRSPSRGGVSPADSWSPNLSERYFKPCLRSSSPGSNRPAILGLRLVRASSTPSQVSPGDCAIGPLSRVGHRPVALKCAFAHARICCSFEWRKTRQVPHPAPPGQQLGQ